MTKTLFSSGLGAASLLTAGLLLAATPARADDEPFTVSVTSPSGAVGSALTATVEIRPGKGRHINKDFPTSLKLVAPAGVELPKATMTRKDEGVKIAEGGATFAVPVIAREPGRRSVTGSVSFAVCTDTTCDPRKAKLSFDVDAK